MRLKYKLERRWIAILALVPLVLAIAVVGSQAKSHSSGWLGVYIQDIDEDLMDSEDLPSTDGVLVIDVIDDSPAEKAGLERGDVILVYDGKDARSSNRLTRLIERSDPGDKKELVILRNGSKDEILVTIGEDDDDMDISFFGRGDHDWHVEIPHIPSPPRAFTFSLGNVSTSRIGVSLYGLSDQLAKHYGAEDGGALVNEVVEDGPAEKAGLQAGDVIVKMDGKSVEDIDEIREAIQDKDEGETVAVTVMRDGRESTLDVEVEESNTWSGMGDHRFFTPRSNDAKTFRWNSRNDWSNEVRSGLRESLRDVRGDYGEWREELEEAMKELREELRELKKELKEKGL
jgi:serine protease Do